jgi:hypothetical protein
MPRMLMMSPSDTRTQVVHLCWHCRHWGGIYARVHGLCNRPGNPRVQAMPAMGCAFFEREPGADDDLWQAVAPVKCDRRPRL